MDRFAKNLRWWQDRAALYPFHVDSPSSLSPLEVVRARAEIGPFIRAICEPNIARWGFKKLEVAKKFAEMFLEKEEAPSPNDVYELPE